MDPSRLFSLLKNSIVAASRVELAFRPASMPFIYRTEPAFSRRHKAFLSGYEPLRERSAA